MFGGRQGQDKSGAKAGLWRPSRTQAFVDGSNCSVWMHLEFPEALVQDYGAPEKLWLGYNFSANGRTHADVQLLWFNKTATRIAESFMFEFTPSAPGGEWWMRKLATYVNCFPRCIFVTFCAGTCSRRTWCRVAILGNTLSRATSCTRQSLPPRLSAPALPTAATHSPWSCHRQMLRW